ncbi:MAG: sensor domain-containing diguanylate cyclase [Sphingomonas sp.]|uniref:GGDEF domain-containing protein n=1 Tax=Sphingomonas sp. TaxID=28214 RepID=UPI0011FEEECD|nr:diguanylate cyclase [Sphingomonas sp.]THD35201.1 MAG: sensor domain-containing diguanylate cyclase [Sphingomonas sp.]
MADAAPMPTDDTLLRARLGSVYALAVPTIAMDLLGSTLLAGYFWSPARAGWLLTWLGATVVLCAGRGGAAFAFRTGRIAHVPARSIAKLLVLFAGLSALLWSGAVGWMLDVGTDNQVMFVVCIVLAAVSMTIANVAYWPVYAMFAMPVTLAAASGLALSGRPGHLVLAGAGFALALAMLAISRRLANQIVHAYRLAITNQALVDSLGERGRELEQACDALERVSRTDPLTGLANRRSRDMRLADEWTRAVRNGGSLAVVAIDVDRFKKFNDTHGHDEGDRALQAVADMLQAGIRVPIDLAARQGGEEFMLILPGVDLAGAASIAERVRVMVAKCGADPAYALPDKVTISLGVAAMEPAAGRSVHELTIAADAALYQAKMGGRNRYELGTITPVASAA